MTIKVNLFCFLLMTVCSNLWAQSLPAENYEVVAEDAAWCWFSDPRAVYHKGSNERVYYGYITSRGDVMIAARDVKTNRVQSYNLHAKLQIDDHNVPSILFLPDDRLIAFYTEHNGRFFLRRSKNPEDITAWEDERVIPFGGNGITYSHPVMLKNENNRIYMFWRGSDWRPTFSFSDDLGDTWSASKALINSKGTKNRPYLKVVSDNKSRIDFVFTDGHPGVEPQNSVYHMFYRAGNFYQSGGSGIADFAQLPIEHEKVQKVYDGKQNNIRAWISDIALDKRNNPVIVYTRYPKNSDHRYHYARWDGEKWQDEEICKAGTWMPLTPAGKKETEPHYSGGISLDHSNPSEVILARQVSGVFEIEQWEKTSKSWKQTPITANSAVNNVRPYVVSGYKGRNPFILWMTGDYIHWRKFDTDLRINELKK